MSDGYEGEYSNPAVALTNSTSGSSASLSVTVPASARERYGILAFSGYAEVENFKITISIGGVVVWTHFGTAASTSGATFSDPKIIHTSENEALVVTVTPASGDACGINLSYRKF